MNLKFTAWPEMLVWPYLITRGWLPYLNMAIVHTPILNIVLALFYKIGGVEINQLKYFTWIIIVLSDLILYLIANKIWGKKTAIFSVISFAIWQIFFDGNGLWFEILIIPQVMILFYSLYRKKYLLSGIIWSLMIFTKQTSIWFAIPIVYEIWKNGSKKQQTSNIKNIIFGALVTGVIALVGLYLWGVLPAFWSWAIKFGVFVLPRSNGQIQLPGIKNILVSVYPFLIFFVLISIDVRKNINLLFWIVAGCLGAYPRFEYFHFQPGVPFLGIVSGLIYANFSKMSKYQKYVVVVYLFGALYLFSGFFMRNYREGVRFYDQSVINIERYVKEKTSPDDKIFVMNWWDSIYALTDTFPATNPLIPQLSWYQELPGIQDNEIRDLKAYVPKLILLQPYSETGLSSYIPQKLYDYVLANYKIKDKIDGIEIYVPKQQ